MGHAESAAAMCSIAKIVISAQERKLPPNLHFNQPREGTENLFEEGGGALKVVTETTPWDGGLVGVSSFGLGGTNAHAILEVEAETRKVGSKNPSDIPILVPLSGRTEEGVKISLEKVRDLMQNLEFTGLVRQVFHRNIPDHLFRGYATLNPGTGDEFLINVNALETEEASRPLWYVFSGMGSQHYEMAAGLSKIDVFSHSMNNSGKILKNIGVDLNESLKPGNPAIFENIHAALVTISSVQVRPCLSLSKDFKVDQN
jgi:fatty acid synthase, animal type